MKYLLKKLLPLDGSALDRLRIQDDLFQSLWPILSLIAVLYRVLFLWRTKRIVIIGSLGKTTTYQAVNHALGNTTQVSLNRNSKSYLAMQILRTPFWSPFVVIEVGIDRPGQMARYAAIIRPAVVIVTSLASEHNRSLGSLEKAAAEKSVILKTLPKNGLAILNGDDPLVRQMASQTRARVVTYGFSQGNEIQAMAPVLRWPHGMDVTIRVIDRTVSIQTKLFGRHMMYPIMAAMATAHFLGQELPGAVARLEKMNPVPGRMQLELLPSGAYLLRDDFKSTLETVHSALDLLQQIPASRKIVVLGQVSEPPLSQGPIYRALGARLAQIADTVVFIAGKSSQRYLAGIRQAKGKGSYNDADHDITAAIRLLAGLKAGDVILVKGRDTERLERISLSLMGWKVNCFIPHCNLRIIRCDQCPMVKSGWRLDATAPHNR